MQNLEDILTDIRRMYDCGELQQALELARQLTHDNTGNAEAWFMLGKILWRLDRRAEATSAYHMAAELDSTSPAVIALRHAEDIADFFNPDLFNP